MTEPDPRRLEIATELLSGLGDAISPRQLADVLGDKTTGPVYAYIKAQEFPAIRKGHGRYAIPKITLIPWLADRLAPAPEENQ